MRVQLRKTSGGYELFIPDEMASAAALSDEVTVEAMVLGDRLMVWQPEHTQMKLEELVAKITPENRHELIDFGPPVGKEVW